MKDQTLRDVDDRLIEAGRFMEDVAREPNKVQCLERFAKCKEIVEWLKGVTKGYLLLLTFLVLTKTIYYACFKYRCS